MRGRAGWSTLSGERTNDATIAAASEGSMVGSVVGAPAGGVLVVDCAVTSDGAIVGSEVVGVAGGTPGVDWAAASDGASASRITASVTAAHETRPALDGVGSLIAHTPLRTYDRAGPCWRAFLRAGQRAFYWT